jgi:hypothetical protein
MRLSVLHGNTASPCALVAKTSGNACWSHPLFNWTSISPEQSTNRKQLYFSRSLNSPFMFYSSLTPFFVITCLIPCKVVPFSLELICFWTKLATLSVSWEPCSHPALRFCLLSTCQLNLCRRRDCLGNAQWTLQPTTRMQRVSGLTSHAYSRVHMLWPEFQLAVVTLANTSLETVPTRKSVSTSVSSPVTPYGQTVSIFIPEDGGSMFLRNIGIFIQVCMVLQHINIDAFTDMRTPNLKRHSLSRAVDLHTVLKILCSLWLISISYIGLLHQGGDDGGSTHLWNFGLLQRDYTALYPRRL